jgi:UDP-glucose 4-epimerase
MPCLLQVASGSLAALSIHGGDYPARDGTGVRDYIHVKDLTRGHLAALDAMEGLQGAEAFNLGTGLGSSVLELIKAMYGAVVVGRGPGPSGHPGVAPAG